MCFVCFVMLVMKVMQEHLFFQCGFSLRIWRTLISACLFTDIPSEWENVMTWSIATLRGKSFHASFGKLC
jgi:hypothetical protein